MTHPLTVYKASAGSGKTFTLAVEYIRLLIVNPSDYKSILAVTFTKKATEEMKTRILSQLYGIWKRLPASDGYLQEIVKRLSDSRKADILQEEERQGRPCSDIREAARRRAGIALTSIIHDYGRFRVETIDSFFQRIIRNLARELDLMTNMRISLDEEMIGDMAVEELFDELNDSRDELHWIMAFIDERMDDEKAWNVMDDIKKFGKNIFQDFYKQRREELARCFADKHFFDRYKQKLRKMANEAQQTMIGYSDLFFKTLDQTGIARSELKGGERSGICSYFRKLASDDFSDKTCINATLLKHLESGENWVAQNKGERGDIIISIADTTLLPLLREAEERRPAMWRDYMSAKATLVHLDKVRLLGSIEAKVRQMTESTGTFMLCDTQSLISELIGDGDAPFIYEKTGAHLKYIMIDEFQDTSTTQWHNFKVLLNDTMSHSHDGNLIVGDVKQSIYRWRSGDWRLLNDIRHELPALAEDDVKNLDTNYRSEPDIVTFNNTFFRLAAERTRSEEKAVNEAGADELATAYSDVEQHSAKRQHSPDNTGLVTLTLLPKDKDRSKASPQAGETQQTGPDDLMLQAVVDDIDMLLRQGTPQSDIAILVRENKDITEIAEHFMAVRPEVRLVSDEAFHLKASLAVNAMIQAMTVLITPGEILPRTELAKSYERVKAGIGRFRQDQADSGRFRQDEAGRARQEPAPIAEQLDELRDELLSLSLTDLCEQLYRLLHIDLLTGETAYICAFNDAVRDFLTENYSDVSSLLEAWEATIKNKTIPGGSIDGIRILTIHKSKGLEFDNVIIPYCDWTLEKSSTLWLSPTTAPFNELPIVPINYEKKLLGTIYDDDYREEHSQKAVDNLNLLYVAFTRAKRNLFVIGKRSGRGKLIEALLPELERELNNRETPKKGAKSDAEPLVFSYGAFSPSKDRKQSTTDDDSSNVFLTKPQDVSFKIETFDTPVEFRQSNESRRFVADSDDSDNDDSGSRRLMYMSRGNILHSIFARIRTEADIPYIIRELQTDGTLYSDDVTADDIERYIGQGMANERVRHWFSPHWKLFNECSIIYEDEQGRTQKRRPDRVVTDGQQTIVIDFKFARPREEHHEQVRQYVRLLRSMGYPCVSGCLWYGYTNDIEEVEA